MISKLLGNICVDSGLVFIGDPCYLNDIAYQEILNSIKGRKYYALNFKNGYEGAGVISVTHDGDGSYPVYGAFKEGDSRPSQIIIDFKNDPINQDDNV